MLPPPPPPPLVSALLATYVSLDPRARALIFLVKAWAKARRLNEAPNGTPSSYCHAVLVLFYLTKVSSSASLGPPGQTRARG